MIESDGMLRHLVFFEELGKMDESDPGWRAVSAGLVTMRLVDQWIADGATASRVDTWSVSAVREAIAEIVDTTPVRRILTSIVDTMVSSTATDMHALTPRLMAYGQSLEYEAKWSLAADVYATIAANAHPVEDADLAVAAFLQLGFCLRTLGELDSAAIAYNRASQVALAVGDLMGVLRGRLGDAKIASTRGNMPQAEAILDEAIEQARSHGLDDVHSRALTDRATVAGLRGQYDRAVRFSYNALELSKSQRERDRILSNIATGFRYLGLMDVARDAYLVLAATAQEQYTRWNSELNLMELAAYQGGELQFDKYRRDLESADFTPQLRVTYLLHVGRGYTALSQPKNAVPYLERAIAVASEYGLNQLMFEAENALADAKRAKTVTRTMTAPVLSADVEDIALAIHQMKETAGLS